MPVSEVRHPDDAEVILATGLDFRDVEQHRTELQNGQRTRRSPTVRQPGTGSFMWGKNFTPAQVPVADLYESMDGPVQWFGKPTAQSLHTCVQERGLSPDIAAERVIMIGDSLQTDIAGAEAAGF